MASLILTRLRRLTVARPTSARHPCAGWARNVKSAVLHVISLAHYAIVAARGWAANSIIAHLRLSCDVRAGIGNEVQKAQQ